MDSLTSPGGSSASPPSTTSCSSRSRSACRAIVAGLRDRVGAHRQPGVPAADEVLRQALPDQLRDRRGHRHRAGVPVRHELARLLAVRRRHLRRPAGHRGRCSRSSSSRRSSACGSSAGTGCPRSLHAGLHLAGAHRHRCCRRTSSSPRTPGCSTRSATRYNPDTRPRRADRLLGGADQQGAAGDLPARRRSRRT